MTFDDQKRLLAKERDRYPDDWPAIAERIKHAAGGNCERCSHADILDVSPWFKPHLEGYLASLNVERSTLNVQRSKGENV